MKPGWPTWFRLTLYSVNPAIAASALPKPDFCSMVDGISRINAS